MQNSNYARKICTVICALLCVGSLSGCSAALQSLADGTDDVLNGLADATDSVMNDLADGADQALSFLSEADDGQTKDSILRAFSALVDDAGTVPLTSQNKLQGHREKGIDDYTGSYKATYSDFAGTELLFGGTTLKREAGNTIRINCSLSLESGEAASFSLLRRRRSGHSSLRKWRVRWHCRSGWYEYLCGCLGRPCRRNRIR